MDWSSPTAQFLAFGAMGAVFGVIALVELLAPRRRLEQSKARRWTTNLALFAIDTVAVRVLVPLLLVGMAAWAGERGWGLFNALLLPWWVEFVAAIVLLDLALWVQHLATHRVPFLWRMHRVHHADRDFDVTTGARFHPFEIVLSMLYKMAVVAALGPAVAAVFAFELLFNLHTMLTHANFGLRGGEGAVRRIFVTPDMHRVHHSTRRQETDSNYGTILSLWDRIFGTYNAEPAAGQRGFTVGLAHYRDEDPQRLGWSLWLPFAPNPAPNDGKAK